MTRIQVTRNEVTSTLELPAEMSSKSVVEILRSYINTLDNIAHQYDADRDGESENTLVELAPEEELERLLNLGVVQSVEKLQEVLKRKESASQVDEQVKGKLSSKQSKYDEELGEKLRKAGEDYRKREEKLPPWGTIYPPFPPSILYCTSTMGYPTPFNYKA